MRETAGKTLTAFYDLRASPLTFDFAYAVAQAEVERRRRGYQRLRFHLRLKNSREAATDPLDDEQWRLCHIVAPLTRLLAQPADLVVAETEPRGADIFARPFGLYWLSDVIALAEAGHDVQVFAARAEHKAALSAKLAAALRGRRLITITLRETRYAKSRNSDLFAWAALSRSLCEAGYAVAVLRDHERVSEALPGDWGEAFVLSEAVWELHHRLALYELAWLNLCVNNGPSFLALLDPHTRVLMFKMLGETPETSPQHCRRLGFEPGGTLPFLKPGQRLVWDIDEVGVLHERVFAALSELDTPPPAAPPTRSAAECIVEAARRDYRAGLPAGDDLGRLPPGKHRAAIAVESAAMLLDEDRALDAATALADAPPGPAREAMAVSIAHSRVSADIIERLAPLMIGSESADWQAALTRAAAATVTRLPPPPAPRPAPELRLVELDGSRPLDKALRFVAASLRPAGASEGRNTHLVIHGGDTNWLSVSTLFPSISAVTHHPDSARLSGYAEAENAPATIPKGVARVPVRAKAQLQSWREVRGIGRAAYALFAPGQEDAMAGMDAAAAAAASDLTLVQWSDLAPIWPIEMLAAVLDGATLRVVSEPLALALADILGLPATSQSAAPYHAVP